MQFGGCPDLFPIQLYHLGHWYQQCSSKNSNIWNGKLEALETDLHNHQEERGDITYGEDF